MQTKKISYEHKDISYLGQVFICGTTFSIASTASTTIHFETKDSRRDIKRWKYISDVAYEKCYSNFQFPPFPSISTKKFLNRSTWRQKKRKVIHNLLRTEFSKSLWQTSCLYVAKLTINSRRLTNRFVIIKIVFHANKRIFNTVSSYKTFEDGSPLNLSQFHGSQTKILQNS